jgi:hypothetical protein
MAPRHAPAQARLPARRLGLLGLLGLIAVAGLLAGSCRDSERMPGPEARPVITLLDPGAEPRRPLRYRLAPGAEEILVMRTEMTVATRVDGTPLSSVDYPPVVMTLRLRVMNRDRDENDAAHVPGQARYEFALEAVDVEDAPGVQPEVVAAMRRHFQEVTGMTGSADIDARGFNWNARMQHPRGQARDTTPAIRQMVDSASQGMDRMSAPLPEEPVGRGARWELRQTIEQNDVTLQQRTLVELVELDGQRGVLTTQITQRADRQPMTITGMPAGAAELLALDSTGSGRLQFDLDRLVPRSTLAMRSDYGVRVKTEGEPQTIETHVEMRVEITGPR